MSHEIEILLVEDNPDDAELTIRALKKNKLANHVVHFQDGAEALAYIFCEDKYAARNFADKPRVILLDIKMPRIDGVEVLKRVKADGRTKSIPVVVLTSSDGDPDISQCYELGANSYIVKPVGFENFTNAVASMGFYWLLLNELPQEN